MSLIHDQSNVPSIDTYCFVMQVVFEHEGVFIHSSSDESEDQDLISGFLRIVEKVWGFSVVVFFFFLSLLMVLHILNVFTLCDSFRY